MWQSAIDRSLSLSFTFIASCDFADREASNGVASLRDFIRHRTICRFPKVRSKQKQSLVAGRQPWSDSDEETSNTYSTPQLLLSAKAAPDALSSASDTRYPGIPNHPCPALSAATAEYGNGHNVSLTAQRHAAAKIGKRKEQETLIVVF